MTCLLAIDPGKLECGWALFENGVLDKAGLARNPVHKPGAEGPDVWLETTKQILEEVSAERPDVLVMEIPQVYKQGQQKGDQKDLVELAGVDGCIRGLFCLADKCVVYRPAQWKGQTPKPIHNKRVMAKLTQAEIKTFEADTADVPRSLLHNVVDAVGIGLFYLGRMTL